MYTILWTDNDGVDHYDRPEYKDDIKDFVKLLIEQGSCVDSILVFGPGAENHIIPIDEL